VSRLRDKPSCDICHIIYDKKNEDPPCDKCIPETLPENKDALKVYLLVKNQLILTGFGDIVDISFAAIDIVLNLFEIQNKRNVFLKVVTLARHFIDVDRKKESETK